MALKIWLKAVRIWTTIAIILPITTATALAWYYNGVFNSALFALVFIAGIILFSAQSFINDYYDHRSKADDLYKSSYPLSGGSRVIQEGLISPKKLFIAGIIGYSIIVIIGLYLNFILDGITLLIIGMIGIFFNFFYTAPPLRFVYRGFGEFVGGLGTGPIIMIGAYYVQSQVVSIDVLLVSIPFGLYTAAVLMFYKIPAYESDKQAGKRNMVVRFGKKNVVTIFSVLLLLVYIGIIALVLANLVPLWTLLALLSMPFLIKPIKNARQNYEKPEKFAPSVGAAITVQIFLTALFILGLIVDKIV